MADKRDKAAQRQTQDKEVLPEPDLDSFDDGIEIDDCELYEEFWG